MPVSPLFTLISPVTQSANNSPLSQPLTTKTGVLTPVSAADSTSSDLNQGEGGLSFFEQLQAASDLSSLPAGQEFAAYLPPTPALADNQLAQLDSDFIGPLALTNQPETNAESEGVLYGQSIQPINTPISDVDEPQGLQYLESLRRAQPHVQPKIADNVDGEELASIKMEGALTDQDTQVKLAQSDLTLRQSMQQRTQGEMIQPLDPNQQGVNPLMGTSAQNNKMINLDELGMEPVIDESSLDGIDLDSTSIHEQPKTLSMLKEATATASPQTQDPALMQEVKMNTADAATGVLKDSQSFKSMALDQTDTAKTQPQEKRLSTFNKLDVPPQHPQWNDQVAKRISIMASEGIQNARIQLDPPELGSLEVKIKVQNDQVSVAFGSNNQMVRDALEGQSPRLRELLEQQGINLADVNVSEQGRQQEQEHSQGTASGDGNIDGEFSDTDLSNQSEGISLESDSLVDYFA
ncbi:MAG: flagellar hook-length control protein FliK [Oceanicoccus sp.]|jgi:flagellar hook-length control protein FliK